MTNTGHGHVRPRPDGATARCGGPAICPICAREKARETTRADIPEHVAAAAARLRQDIREAIDVCYGELGGPADTPEDVAGTERAVARDMATVLDWITTA